MSVSYDSPHWQPAGGPGPTGAVPWNRYGTGHRTGPARSPTGAVRSRDRFRARHGPLWCLRGAPTADEDEPHSLRHARRADNRHWQRAQWNRVGPASYPHFTGAATSLYGPYMGYHTAAAASRCWHAPIRACRQPPASVCWCQCPGSQAGAHDWIWARRPPAVSARVTTVSGWSLVFGGFAFPPVSLGPAGDCPCKD